MQLVFEKVEVVNLEADLRKIGLSIGDELNLQLDELGSCQAYFTPKQTWLGKIFINRRDQRLGDLSKNDALHLAKQVQDASKARVRVVDAIPKHLSSENKDSVFISIWLKR
jgi:hypothetical protein